VESTSIYLVRHAHAEWQQDENRPLSSRGRADALKLAEQFERIPVEAIHTSPSARAIESVARIAEWRQLVPLVIEDLRERELSAATAAEFEAAVAASWRRPQVPATGGGESNQAAQGRGIAVVRSALGAHDGGHVVLSTHGSLLALILNGFDPAFGYDFWRSLTFPDVYELIFSGGALVRVRRAWDYRV
jgi:2,3-bisphosphoglycerate-dependent phosphoglycerate mutase